MRLNDCAIMFSPDNWGDYATILDGPEADPVLAAANLFTPEMYSFWGLVPGQSYIVLDLQQVRTINVIASLKVTFLQSSRWRIRCAFSEADLTTAPEYDSDWELMFPGVETFGMLPWGDFDWGMTAWNINFGDYNRQAIHVTPDKVMARYVRIDYDLDETFVLGHPARMARLWVGEGYQPTHSAVYGSGVKFEDLTEIKESQSLVKHRSKQVLKRRGMRVILENEPKLELFFRLVAPIISYGGASKDFLTLLEPRDKAALNFQSVYGSISGEVVSVTHSSWGRLGTTLDLQEAV